MRCKPGFDLSKFDNAAGMDAIQRPAAETVDQAIAWLREDRRRPFFAWVHLYDPHAPYAPPEDLAALFPRTASGAYDAEIAYVDLQVGRLVDALRTDGRLSDTVIVVVADHGEMLGDHGYFRKCEPYEGSANIPLLIAGSTSLQLQLDPVTAAYPWEMLDLDRSDVERDRGRSAYRTGET